MGQPMRRSATAAIRGSPERDVSTAPTLPAMRTPARSLLMASTLAALAAARVVLFAVLDRRPLFGGWEAPDLQRSMFYHYGLKGHLDWTFAEQVARDAFKPPLWYGGVPLLFGWKPSLAALDYLLLNALCAAALVIGGFYLARRLGGDRAGVLAAAVCAVMPGIAWRVVTIGVETAHAALLVLSLLALLGLVQSAREARTRDVALRGVALGLCVGAAALMKWNFVAYIAPPALLALVLSGRSALPRAVLGLGLAAFFAAVVFGPWALGYADLSDILAQGARGEAEGERAGYYVSELARRSLGWLGWLMVGAGAAGLVWGRQDPLHAPRPRYEALIVGAAVLALWLLHLWIPHKETRYLLPALPLVAVLLAWPAARLSEVRGGPVVLGVLLAVGAVQSWVMPWFEEPPADHAWSDVLPAPIADDYDIEAVLAHPSLRARERTVVTLSLRPEARFPVLTFLDWELYGRNANPVLARSDWPDVTSKACAFDLERSTHFLSNRQLDLHEESALRSMGFERIVTVKPRIQDVGVLSLWALEARSEPRYR